MSICTYVWFRNVLRLCDESMCRDIDTESRHAETSLIQLVQSCGYPRLALALALARFVPYLSLATNARKGRTPHARISSCLDITVDITRRIALLIQLLHIRHFAPSARVSGHSPRLLVPI